MSAGMHDLSSTGMKTFAEIRSDLGGAKLALEGRGYTCIGSKTWGEFLMPRSHSSNKFHGSDCDILTIQFPSSDNVSGLWGPKGDWISARYVAAELRGILECYNPRTLILTGRNGVFSQGNGSVFAELLISLSKNQYETCWLSLNLSSFGIPQDATRSAIVAIKTSEFATIERVKNPSLLMLSNILRINPGKSKLKKKQCLANILDERRPRIGVPAPKKTNPYGRFGISSSDYIYDFKGTVGNEFSICTTLAGIFGLDDLNSEHGIYSARFVSRSGIRSIQLKRGNLAHSIGPAVSAWPLFAFPKRIDLFSRAEEVFNWRSSFGDFDIGRLTPEASLLLFGPEAKYLSGNLSKVTSSMSAQYRFVAATVAPKVIDFLAVGLEKTLGWHNSIGHDEVH